MERAWRLRQENVLPLETAWNEGRFYGLLLKGNQPFTRVQRAGILFLGLQAIGVGTMIFRLPHVSRVWTPVLLVYIVFGVRFCWVALKHPPRHLDDAE
jgi:hypothetical protein